MGVTKQAPARAAGGRKVRILVVDDDDMELAGVKRALSAGHRELTSVHTLYSTDAIKAFDGHDIVITDQKLSGIDDGQTIAKAIKKKSSGTVIVIRSNQPPELSGGPLEADYTITKLSGLISVNDGKNTEIIGGGKDRWENLTWLVEKIERERLKLTE